MKRAQGGDGFSYLDAPRERHTQELSAKKGQPEAAKPADVPVMRGPRRLEGHRLG